MFAYSEEKVGKRIDYVRHILDEDGNDVSARAARIRLHITEHANATLFVLYDDNMEPIHDAYAYLNCNLRDKPLTSRTKAAYALRLLYQFLSLTNRDIAGIDGQALSELEGFLRGAGSGIKRLGDVTQRSVDTVNSYYSTYRSFLAARGINCPALERASTVRVSANFMGQYESSTDHKRYKSNLPTRDRSREVPLYVSPTEFQRLYKLAYNDHDEQSMLIMRLMYVYGLRIGEVLGLTIEDAAEIDFHGQPIPVLHLRNRLSDRKYQFAKNLPHVTDTAQYSSCDYNALTTTVNISWDTYEQVVSHINASHEEAMTKHPNAYARTIADKVGDILTEGKDNHYLFVNRYGRVLSDQVWNNHLRSYFERAGIAIDQGVRQTNLSHRFRHGFAMFHAQFLPEGKRVDALHLQSLMRHKSISSTMVYYNPTLEDEHRIKEGFQEELYRLIPELGDDAS